MPHQSTRDLTPLACAQAGGADRRRARWPRARLFAATPAPAPPFDLARTALVAAKRRRGSRGFGARRTWPLGLQQIQLPHVVRRPHALSVFELFHADQLETKLWQIPFEPGSSGLGRAQTNRRVATGPSRSIIASAPRAPGRRP